MIVAVQQGSFNELIELSENLIDSINKIDTDELKQDITEYTRKLENYFINVKSLKPAEQNLEELKQIMLVHKKVTTLFIQERDNLSGKLKKLHTGKTMQNTYPCK